MYKQWRNADRPLQILKLTGSQHLRVVSFLLSTNYEHYRRHRTNFLFGGCSADCLRRKVLVSADWLAFGDNLLCAVSTSSTFLIQLVMNIPVPTWNQRLKIYFGLRMHTSQRQLCILSRKQFKCKTKTSNVTYLSPQPAKSILMW